MMVQISIAKNTDLTELCILLDSLFSQEAEFESNHDKQARGLTSIINGENIGEIIIARDDTKIIGMVNLLYTVSTALGGRVGLLEDMIVSRTNRGQGIGSKLIEYTLNIAKENGCERITLLTDHDNENAYRFYKKHGFNHSSMVTFRHSLK